MTTVLSLIICCLWRCIIRRGVAPLYSSISEFCAEFALSAVNSALFAEFMAVKVFRDLNYLCLLRYLRNIRIGLLIGAALILSIQLTRNAHSLYRAIYIGL